MNHGVAGKVEARAALAVEERDLGRIADAEQRALQRDGIVNAQRPDLRRHERRHELCV